MVEGAARGVYVTRDGGGYRIRWEQWEEAPDGSRSKRWKSARREALTDAISLSWEIRRALDAQGWWAPEDRGPLVRPADVDLEAVIAVEWLAWKRDTRGAAAGTLSALAGALTRFFRALREVAGIRAGAPIPCSKMTIETFSAVNGVLARTYSGGTPYQTAAALYDMWCWASDMGRWPALPPAPRTAALVLPRQHAYVAPSVEPRVDEADAMLRRLAFGARRYGPEARRLAVIQRYTGLRIEQAAAIWREDVSLDDCTLLIRKGKSRREQALMRLVPVSPWLVEDLRGWLEAAPDGPLFPGLRNPRNTTRWVTEAWDDAIEAGEVRRGVVYPPNRAKSRPTHVFRALFQGILEAHGVPTRVVDHLVGHAPKDTRGRSYVTPPWDVQMASVQHIPRIEWGEGRRSPDAADGLRLVRTRGGSSRESV